MLVEGPPGAGPNWDRPWRLSLVENLGVVVGQLWAAGITEIFADGSFVTGEGHPNDIDVYFHCQLKELASGLLHYKLNIAAGGSVVWSWDPKDCKPDQNGKLHTPMWHRYRVDPWPHYSDVQIAGPDIHGNPLTFPSFFRQSRAGKPRGIIKIGGHP